MGGARWWAAASAIGFVLITLLVVLDWSVLVDLDRDAVDPSVEPARAHDGYRRAMQAATFALNSQLVMLYALLIGLVVWLRGRRAEATWLVLVVWAGSALSPLLKQLVGRERPVVVQPVEAFSGLSFPSGHATSAALICTTAAVLLVPRLGARGRVLLVVTVLVVPALSGWTRMTLGGHYLSDVVAGTLLGGAWVGACTAALPRLRRRLEARER